MKALCYAVASVVLFSWVSFIVAGMVRVARLREGLDPGWAGETSTYALVIGVFGFIACLMSWVLAVYVWSKVPGSGALHAMVLIPLVLLGLFVSPFYLLARARVLSKARS